MSSDTKQTVICTTILIIIYRSMFFPNEQVYDALKLLFGGAIMIAMFLVADNLVQHSRNQRKYQEQRLKITHEYYQKLIEIERNDPRRLNNLEDIDEFIAMYNKYKEGQK